MNRNDLPDPDGPEPASEAQYSAWRRGDLPDIEEVREGLWAIPVPFPNHPMRFTYAYLVVGRRRAALIDPGWESEEGWAALCAGIRYALGGGTGIDWVIGTHGHPDHVGMAPRLQTGGAIFALGPERRSYLLDPEREDELLSTWGVPDEERGQLHTPTAHVRAFSELASPDIVLGNAASLDLGERSLHVRYVAGHTAGSIMLEVEGEQALLTGDHILPRTSPHVCLEPGGLSDPVRDYLGALQDLAGRDDEVLPGHEYRFRGLRGRARSLAQRIRRRLATASAAAPRSGSVWEVAHTIPWKRGFTELGGADKRLAIAQTAAFIRHLQSQAEAEHIAVLSNPRQPAAAS